MLLFVKVPRLISMSTFFLNTRSASACCIGGWFFGHSGSA
jgi:hypothetical protein